MPEHLFENREAASRLSAQRLKRCPPSKKGGMYTSPGQRPGFAFVAANRKRRQRLHSFLITGSQK